MRRHNGVGKLNFPKGFVHSLWLSSFLLGPMALAQTVENTAPLPTKASTTTSGLTDYDYSFNDFRFSSSSFSKFSEARLWNAYDKNKKLQIIWSAESSGESYADTTDESFIFSVSAKAKIKYKLLDRLSFRSSINMNFRNGRVQSRFGDFVPNGIFLSYGHFELDVLGNNNLMLEVGALGQQRVFSPVLIGNRSFPGLAQSIDIKSMDQQLRWVTTAQQLIPTSYTFNTELIEKEELPTLVTLKSDLSYATRKFMVGGYAGYFSFSDLPSKVADQSRFTGSSVIGTNATSEFIFDFQGWLAGAVFKYRPSYDTAFGFEVDMLQNNGAPETFNQSQLLRFFASHRLNKDFGFDLIYGNYFVESDAVPGYYTPTSFGNTNRTGNYIEFGLEWIPQKVRVSGRYVKADLINQDDTGRQYDADFIFINLETAYDSIL